MNIQRRRWILHFSQYLNINIGSVLNKIIHNFKLLPLHRNNQGCRVRKSTLEKGVQQYELISNLKTSQLNSIPLHWSMFYRQPIKPWYRLNFLSQQHQWSLQRTCLLPSKSVSGSLIDACRPQLVHWQSIVKWNDGIWGTKHKKQKNCNYWRCRDLESFFSTPVYR